MDNTSVQIIGRTGSLFTRMPLIFAEELGIAYELVAVDDLGALEPHAYAGNPLLRVPILLDADSVLFGAQNICRALADRTATSKIIIWPEDLKDNISRNAQELVWQSMAVQVQILMGMDIGKLPGDNLFFAKAHAALQGALRWLEEHVRDVLSSLPEQRDLSLLEVSLFCLIDHLQFGPTVSLEGHPSLLSFAEEFAQRPSAQRTPFR